MALVMGALLLAFTLGSAGCGDDDSGDDEGSAGTPQTLTRGTLLVGSAIPFPPFELGAPPDYEGFDVDLVREIARRLNLRVEMRDVPFDDLIDDTGRRRVDLAASALTITAERSRLVAFSAALLPGRSGAGGRAGSEVRADLSGERVGVLVDSTSETYAEQQTDARAHRPVRLHRRGLRRTGRRRRRRGPERPAQRDGRGRRAARGERRADDPTNELYGLAVSKRSAALLDAVNQVLGEMKEDGSFERLYERWSRRPRPRRSWRRGDAASSRATPDLRQAGGASAGAGVADLQELLGAH